MDQLRKEYLAKKSERNRHTRKTKETNIMKTKTEGHGKETQQTISSDKYTRGSSKITIIVLSGEDSYCDFSENHFSELPLREVSSVWFLK